MATKARILQPRQIAPRSVGRSVLLTLPIALWSLLMFSHSWQPNRSVQIASMLTAIFMIALFFMIMRTRSTYRWRRWFFVAMGLLFPVGFIHEVMVKRGAMGIPIEEMIAGRTPFCYLPIPLLILPAAFTKTLVFPGSILPAGGMSGGGMVQNGIFVVLFAGLVITLPLLTKKRTQCAFFCPFGAFQSIFNRTSVFDVKIDRTRCSPCVLCQNACPTMSLTKESIARGETLMSCMKCGACVDACPKHAAVWHIKGTEVAMKPERARLMFLYVAWGMAVMFGGSIIAEGLATILHVFV